MSKTRTLRLEDDEVGSIEKLGELMSIIGQRQPDKRFNGTVRLVATLSSAAMAEMVAALKIVEACAAGGDWYELIEQIEPE